MDIRVLAAALAQPLGAPNLVTISDATSTGFNGKTAGVVFYNNGNFAKYVSDIPIVTGTWLSPQTNISEYEIRATLNSGDSPGTEDTWESLSLTRQWILGTVTPSENLDCEILIEIRWTGNDVVQDSAVYTLHASGPAE